MEGAKPIPEESMATQAGYCDSYLDRQDSADTRLMYSKQPLGRVKTTEEMVGLGLETVLDSETSR